MKPRPFAPLILFAALLVAAGAPSPLRAHDDDDPTPTPIANPTATASPTPRSAVAADSGGDPARIETLVFVRHGEKPASDEGQLTVQGLNRALALPAVLIGKFGAAQYVFAPATSKKPAGKGAPVAEPSFSYVRPLATIEPTAIKLGLPVETKFAFDEIGGLQGELSEPQYQRAVIFIAWEHHFLDEMVKRIVSVFGGDAATVPDWGKDDFDSIFVVRIRSENGRRTATFVHDHEGLDGLSTAYPETGQR